MTEIDLIVKYLERHGSKVSDVIYYNEGFTKSEDFVCNIGSIEGVGLVDNFFFGHVTLRAVISGTIVLTDKNLIEIFFYTYLKGRTESGISVHNMGVNLGMSFLGDGVYEGNKRIYGMGFNKITIAKADLGIAGFLVHVNCNGYIFKMK